MLAGAAFARDPNAERMLSDRGFRDVDPENLRVATTAATTSLQKEQDEQDNDINACIVTSAVDGLVVEDSLILTSLDSLYQVGCGIHSVLYPQLCIVSC